MTQPSDAQVEEPVKRWWRSGRLSPLTRAYVGVTYAVVMYAVFAWRFHYPAWLTALGLAFLIGTGGPFLYGQHRSRRRGRHAIGRLLDRDRA